MVGNRTIGLGLTACLLASGCVAGDPASALERCRGNTTDAELDDNVRIVNEYAGAIAADLQLSWQPVLYTIDFLVLWAQTVVGVVVDTPAGWSHDPEAGVYRYGSESAAIEMSVTDPDGDPVTEDILALDSFLVGATVVYDEQTDTSTITFTAAGPLVDMLGLGSSPSSPLVLDAAGRAAVVESIGTLQIAPDFIAYGIAQSTLVDYHVASPPMTINDLANGTAVMDLEVVEVNASRESIDQELDTITWDVHRAQQRVLGFTTFTLTGGHFDYRGRIDFVDIPLTVVADVDIDCP